MTGLRRALIALAILAFVIGIASVALILTSDHASPRGLAASLILVAGWGFAGTGLYAWDRRPDSRVGPLMTAIGFTWFFQAHGGVGHQRRLRRSGRYGLTLPYAILIHLLISFPSGRLQDRLQRALVAVAYFITLVMQVGWILVRRPGEGRLRRLPGQTRSDRRPRGAGGSDLRGAGADRDPAGRAAPSSLVFRRWRRSDPGQRRRS